MMKGLRLMLARRSRQRQARRSVTYREMNFDICDEPKCGICLLGVQLNPMSLLSFWPPWCYSPARCPPVGDPNRGAAGDDHLVGRRLLATDVAKDTGEKTIEPAHEALPRQLGRLMVMLAGSGRRNNEGPQQKVTIAQPFAVSKFDVTFADWDACVAVGGCPMVSDSGFGRGTRPTINILWADAHHYATWLAKLTGQPYRLLTEAEWEFAARAGTTPAYSWGDDIGVGNANCNGCGSKWDNDQTSPSGRLSQMPLGSSICMAMCGSGLKIVTKIVLTACTLMDRHVPLVIAIIVWSAVVPGSTMRKIFARPPVMGSPPMTGASTLASASRGRFPSELARLGLHLASTERPGDQLTGREG
jgi:Sulfatase-modifying factor enzyme 1